MAAESISRPPACTAHPYQLRRGLLEHARPTRREGTPPRSPVAVSQASVALGAFPIPVSRLHPLREGLSCDPLPVAYFVILLSSGKGSTYAMLTAPRCTVCRYLLSSCISSTAVHSVDGFLCRAEAFQLNVGPLLSLLSLPVLSVPGHVLRSLSAVCLLRVSWFQPPVCVVRGGGPAAPSRGRAVCPAPCAAEALSPSCPRCPRHGQMTYARGFISGLWVLFHSSMCLFRCQCHTVLITMSL